MPALASLVISMAASSAALPSDCSALYEKHLASDMELSWQQFDQTEGSGFRVLAQAGCNREAADLIEAYVEHQDRMRYTLDWHLAQMRAEAGETAAAIIAAKRALRADEAADAPFKWNDYVNAVIAFLEKNRAEFDRHTAVLAAHDEQQGNAMNLKFLRLLEAGFDGSYRDAISVQKR